MHTNRPVTRTFGAAPRKLSGLRVFLMFFVGAGLLCASALVAQAPAAKPAAAVIGDTPKGATFVGADTCASCHEEVVKKFASNPHTKMVLMPGNHGGITFENCH